MMDQTGVFRASVCALAVSVVTTVGAQDAKPADAQPAAPAAAEQPAAAPVAAVEQPAAVPAAETQQPVKPFDPLVRVMNIRGVCEVNNPDVGSFQPVLNNKAYPLGSTFRTAAGSSAFLVFSTQESVQILESSQVVIASPEKCPSGRIIRLVSGKVKTLLRDNLPEGSFGVETPNASCKNMAGRADFMLTSDATTETFQVATITGSIRIEGSQYQIPALRAANTVNIQTAVDHSLSRLMSVSGDFAILLENGTETPVNFGMTPKAVVKIWRESAPVGGRAIISTLVVSPTGMARHRFAYAEGRANLATGELATPVAEGDDKNKDKEELPVLLSTDGKKAPVEREKAVEDPAKEEKAEAPDTTK